ncbi:hypothetical protein SprV_0100094400 [Sparganum proliferum]
MKATMAELLKAIQESRQPADPRPPLLKLPLCTNEAYRGFVSELEKNATFAQDAIKRLAITDGRNEKEFIRNLLTTLLGFPLCLTAIRDHAAFSTCTVDTIRKSTIDWFHGARDRYGGRSKRRDNTTLHAIENTTEQYPQHSPSEDTIPATDMDG